MQATQQLLNKFPILQPLPEGDLVQLAENSRIQKLSRRGVVLKAGIVETHVCFLFEGRLQGVNFTIDGREVGLYFVEPGDFCGELALFDGETQPEFVMALTSSVTVMIPFDSLREVMQKHPYLVTAFGLRIATRVRQLTQQRTFLGLPNIAQRVCCQLWELIPISQRQPRDSATAVINNPPTHQEIAIMLNVSRETVTRVFQALQQRLVVRRDGAATLQVLDMNALKQFAEGNIEL